jgi:uncharacterized membrane protein
LVAWLSIALGSILIYLSVGQLLALFLTPSGMSSSPSQSARDFVGQYGQGIGLTLIFAGQWIRGRKPKLKLRTLPRFGKAALLIALIATTQTFIGPNLRSIVPVFAWGGMTHEKTLTEAAIDMAVAYDYMGVYQYRELDWKTGFGEYVKDGSVREDDTPNDFYHFYSPASGSGLEWQWYFPIRAVLDGASVVEPPGDVFVSAYVRARSGWENLGYLGDKLNWYGALKAYDYTPDSKKVAYNRLGHVAHLLEDMAAPDHANLVGHPGSSKSRSEILGMVAPLVGLIIGLVAGGIVGALTSWLLGKAIVYFIVLVAGERYGFEKLIRERSVNMGKFLVPQPQPEYRRSLKAYFDLMAADAETEAASSGLLAPKGRTALGVDNLNIGEIDFPTPFGSITLFPGFPTGIPLLPAINPYDTNDAKPYHDLTDSLGTKALARTTGLLMWYYDIVDFPPYVKRVSITQGGEVKYKVEWQDMMQFDDDIGANRVVSRKLTTSTNKTLESGKLAEISVVFGPEGGTNESPVLKEIWRPEVRVGGVKVDGNMVSDNVWKGEYTPQLGGCKEELKEIEIIAYDRDRHHVEGSEDDDGARTPGRWGNVLDSDPASPAKLQYHPGHWPEPPYNWFDAGEYAYTPGWDKGHYNVAVRPNFQFASVTPDEASLLAQDGQSYHFTISMGNGPADVKLKAQGVPPGAQAEFYPSASVHIPDPPHTANVILKITVSSATPVGSYKIQIVKEGETPSGQGLFVPITCYPVVTLNVKPFMPLQPTADFTISADPSNSTVEAGSSTTTKIRVSSVTQPIYGMPISLSLSSPAGFTVTLSPPPAAGQPYFEKMMEVKVAPTVEAGKTYQITVTGTGTDGKTHFAIFTVYVKRPFTTTDFGIKVNPSSGTVQAGFYTTAEVQVATSLPDWYPYTVTLYSSAPSGWLVSLSPPPPSGQPIFTKLMQVMVPSSAQPGSYTVTITGVGVDFKTHQAIFTVLVTAPPPSFNYVISASPALQSVIKGQTATYTVAITIIGGSTQPVSLSLRGLPSGATFNFRPSTGNPTYTSTLLVTTTTQTPRGDYTLTIVASGGGVVRSATVTLRVVEPVR